jgi:transcriptional antiterminator NusG
MMSATMDEKTAGEPSGDDAGKQWFVLKVQSNREKSIRDSLLRRIRREGLEEEFGEIVIPTEKVVETKGGKKKVKEQKLFPGYMMIQMRLTEETWYLVRDTSGVGDFTGAAGKPSPMAESEVMRMLGRTVPGEEEKVAAPVVKFTVQVGDTVKVKEGAFESFEGAVDALDETSGKVKVMIEIFGRSTEVELEHWQIEKI